MKQTAYSEPVKLIEVHCKGECPTAIAIVTPAGEVEATAAHATLTIVLRDATGELVHHQTDICATCKERILTDGPRPGELKAIYAADIQPVLAQAMALVARTPLMALDDEGRGKAA